jgi:hypothetical protein
MAGFDPAIHGFRWSRTAWITGSCPVMTITEDRYSEQLRFRRGRTA